MASDRFHRRDSVRRSERKTADTEPDPGAEADDPQEHDLHAGFRVLTGCIGSSSAAARGRKAERGHEATQRRHGDAGGTEDFAPGAENAVRLAHLKTQRRAEVDVLRAQPLTLAGEQSVGSGPQFQFAVLTTAKLGAFRRKSWILGQDAHL